MVLITGTGLFLIIMGCLLGSLAIFGLRYPRYASDPFRHMGEAFKRRSEIGAAGLVIIVGVGILFDRMELALYAEIAASTIMGAGLALLGPRGLRALLDYRFRGAFHNALFIVTTITCESGTLFCLSLALVMLGFLPITPFPPGINHLLFGIFLICSVAFMLGVLISVVSLVFAMIRVPHAPD